MADFSSETVGPRKQWANIVKMIKEIDCLPRILYPAKPEIRSEGQMQFQLSSDGLLHGQQSQPDGDLRAERQCPDAKAGAAGGAAQRKSIWKRVSSPLLP